MGIYLHLPGFAVATATASTADCGDGDGVGTTSVSFMIFLASNVTHLTLQQQSDGDEGGDMMRREGETKKLKVIIYFCSDFIFPFRKMNILMKKL